MQICFLYRLVGFPWSKVRKNLPNDVIFQRLINRSKPALSNDQQQNLTRWAVRKITSSFSSFPWNLPESDFFFFFFFCEIQVLYAATLLKTNDKAYSALQTAMKDGLSVEKCIEAIETA